VGPLKLGYLTLCFFASNSIALLNLPDELIALSFNDLPVIVGQSASLLFCLPNELVPVAFDLVGVHFRSPFG
jgi:hypothetical protein